MFLAAIQRKEPGATPQGFPWTLPVFARLERLEFRTPVTFLVGENGSGKSTLLEGLAVGAGAVSAGSRDLDRDETLWSAHEFARAFRFSRLRHAGRTMFLRAEDALGYTLRSARLAKEANEAMAFGLEARRLEAEEQDNPKELANTRELPEHLRARLEQKYGLDPVARSYGETFLELLRERLRPNGLYLLDEPEVPLSPVRVLALLSMIADRAERDCQFVIATHSPILMALPKSEILLFDNGVIRSAAYDDVEHVRVTKSFLNNPAAFLRRL